MTDTFKVKSKTDE